MWISEPMPVMTRIITADSASRRSVRSIDKSAEVNQVKSVWLICRDSAGMAASAHTCMAAIANEIDHHQHGHAARHRLGQPLPHRRVDEEAGERKQGNQRQQRITI